MAPIPFKITHCSSESDVHPAENITKPETYRFWNTRQPERKAFVDLEFAEPVLINSLYVVNAGSAFIEVLVGMRGQDVKNFQVLLPITTLMTLRERLWWGRNSVPLTHNLYLHSSRATASQRWQCARVIVSQPFLSPTHIGLASIEFLAADATPGVAAGAAFVVPLLDELDEPARPAAAAAVAQWEHRKKAASTGESSAAGPDSEGDGSGVAAGGYFSVAAPLSRGKSAAVGSAAPAPSAATAAVPSAPSPSKAPAPSATVRAPSKGHAASAPEAEPPAKKEKTAPAAAPAARPLAGVVVVISGIANPERGQLRQIVLELGGGYRPDWTADATHLVCAAPGSDKHLEALEAGGVVVTKDWVYQCQRKGARVDPAPFVVPVPVKPSLSSPQAGKKHSLSSPAHPSSKLVAAAPAAAAPTDAADSDSTQDMDDEEEAAAAAEEEEKAPAAPSHGAHAPPGAAPPRWTVPPLPDFLRGVRVHMAGPFAPQTARLVRRYVTAYDGHVDASANSGTTHVVVADRSTESVKAAGEAMEKANGADVVTADWVLQCHAAQKRVDEDPYRV